MEAEGVKEKMEGQVGLEPTTSRFGILRDVHFRFWPMVSAGRVELPSSSYGTLV